MVDKDAHQRETITKWPIWLALNWIVLFIKFVQHYFNGFNSFQLRQSIIVVRSVEKFKCLK